ncbi:hypothetical protein BYT27DRAFT_7185231 [Phlegmacium glaucopus]|nr:hypothetical protein BYT27DRAFT_7185231 [Phlegmacium glaucopus]
MNFQNPTLTPATASARVRAIWRQFEMSQAKDRAQLDISVQKALEKAEAAWNKSPINGRMSRNQHNVTKVRLVKSIKTSYFEKARAKWDEKLELAGLKVEHWTDLTEDEKRRITNALGADDESDEDVVVVVSELPQASVTQPTQTSYFQPLAPSFSTSSRATNLSSSSYAFVNPSEFNSEEEDFEFETPFSNPVATSADLTSEDDDDVAFSVPAYSATRSSVVASGFSRASSLQNSASNIFNPPLTRPLASDFAYNTAPSRAAATKRPPTSQNEGKPAPTKGRIPRQPYVGPSLEAADEPIDEELEFEKFKMRTRMEKIVEFHEAAAVAEISLSIEIYKARKQLNNSKEEDAPRVLEHQKRMVQLQKEKEEERKAIVKSERARRQSELGRRLTHGAVKEPPVSSAAFKTCVLSSFEDEVPLDLPSRFNLDTLLSEDPAKQQRNVESLLSEMFADDSQPYSGPEVSAASFLNSYSSASSNQDAFRGSASFHDAQEHFRPSHSSMSWNKPQSNPSPKPPRKTHLSPFGESSDEEDNKAAALRKSNENSDWGIDESDAKPTTPIWNNKPNAPTPAVAGAWASKDVRSTPVSSAWSTKKVTGPTTQPRQGSSILSNPNPLFVADETEPEPTATPVTNSKANKGKKTWVSASDKSSVSPPAVETTTASSKAPAAETSIAPPKADKPPPPAAAAPPPTPAVASAVPPAPTPVPAPVGKKQNKKRQANKKGGAVAAPAAVAEPVIPEPEPETEPAPPQQESPKLETAVPAPDPVSQDSEYTSWLPKMVPAMARARLDSGPTTPSFSWDEVTSTPRPAAKIPAHVQEAVNLAGTPRPSMLKKANLMADVFSATSSRTTLEQMPPAPIAKGPWGLAAPAGPSLWGKTKADFETAKVAQQPAGGDFWVPGGFDGVDNYNGEGEGEGSGGDENAGVGLWESITTHSKQIGKVAPVPVKQQQPSVAAQRLRRVSEAASSPAPRVLGTKDLSDIGQPPPPTLNSNSKKARGKKNGKGKQPAVTIEDVSDEEKDNIDILPADSGFIMESKVILEPKPSVPPVVYNSIIDFADNDPKDIGSSSNSFRPTASTARNSSPDDFFSSESLYSNTFKSQGANTSVGPDWGAIGGKHARWTPAVSHAEELPNFSTFGSRLQTKPSVQQQTPIWGQSKPNAKDKGKGK